ncbi:MAG TPA: ABC transporter ATP-binding protein [Anaerolineales bacterium]|nr:ABC transporter ATP-binding protein [Anaerolineales bacterium]
MAEKMSTYTAIELNQLERTYLSGSNAVRALRGIDMTIPAGRFVALKGRSGSGKTTLLNCVGGLDQPTAGSVTVYGRSLSEMGEKELTDWRRIEVGFIFQAFGLLPTLSAYENVELILRLAKKSRDERKERAMYCLDLVGLGKWAHHRPHEMSGGQQQRVAIARAFANAPRLILADEPTGELDSETSLEILDLFQSLVKSQNMTMLMATHDSLVDEFVDEILVLRDGRVNNG